MNKDRLVFFLLPAFLLLASVPGFCQFFSGGQEPGSVRWQALRGKYFTVIYPLGLDTGAAYLSTQLPSYGMGGDTSFMRYPKHLQVVYHGFMAAPNGLVAWAPKRMEIISQYPQHSYSLPWLDQLAVHELRHAAQMASLGRGVGRLSSIFSGQIGVSAIAGICLPPWLLEGDAVMWETWSGPSGRGRQSEFAQDLRWQLLSNKIYTYNKAIFGSYKDFIPNRYVFGYHFLVQADSSHHTALAQEVIRRAGSFPLGFPLARACKRLTGKSRSKLYRQSWEQLKSKWNEKQEQSWVHEGQRTACGRLPSVTNLASPMILPNGQVAGKIGGYSIRPQLAEWFPSGKRKRLCLLGSMNSFEEFSLGGGRIVWSELAAHPRWKNVQYSNIICYDIKAKKRRQLTKRGRFFAPRIAPNGNIIAACSLTKGGNASIVLMDRTGKHQWSIATVQMPASLHLLAWIDRAHVAAFMIDKRGRHLLSFSVSDDTPDTLWHCGHADVRGLWRAGDGKLFYSIGSEGNENINLFDCKTKQHWNVTGEKLGAFSPSISGDTLIYARLDSAGWRFARLPQWEQGMRAASDPSLHTSLQPDGHCQLLGYCPSAPRQADTLPLQKRPYRRGLHAVNIHSWLPLFYMYDEDVEQGLGFTLYSQDRLGLTTGQAGWRYLPASGARAWIGRLQYAGAFSIIFLSANQEIAPVAFDKKNTRIKALQGRSFEYQSSDIALRLALPCSWARGGWRFTTLGSIGGGQYWDNPYMDTQKQMEALAKQQLILSSSGSYGNSGLQFSAGLPPRYRDLASRLMISLSLSYMRSLDDLSGKDRRTAAAQLNLPGLLRHHSLTIYGAAQYRKSAGTDFFSNGVQLPRGVAYLAAVPESQVVKCSYLLPLAYPDLSLGTILYAKRIQCTLFYDRYTQHNGALASYGCDLSAQGHIGRFVMPITAGVRLVKAGQRAWATELLLEYTPEY